MRYQSTKTFCHSEGLSACFRQWRAKSHCRFLHGYALEIKLTFEAKELDDRNWVVDFGGLKEIKEWLKATFDHKLLVALDDPKRVELLALADHGLVELVVIPDVGCEKFAEHIFKHVQGWLASRPEYCGRVELVSAEVREHGGNSAIVKGDNR